MKTPFLKRRPKDEIAQIVKKELEAVKATESLGKPPYAKAPPSRHIPSDDPKPRVNTAYNKVPKAFLPRRRRNPRKSI